MKLRHFAIAAVLIAGCTTTALDLPAISDSATGERDQGRVVWHDLLTTTPEESRRFYGELFGWTFEKPGITVGFGGSDAYMLIRHEGRLIGGMVDARNVKADENVSQWITVISTADIDAATAAVRASGGNVISAPVDLPTRGQMGVYADASGAIFALVQTRDGDPESTAPAINGFLWDELWTQDVPGAIDFYGNVLGFRHEVRTVDEDVDYQLFMRGDEPAAGVLSHPFERKRPVWAPYLRVADPAAITTKVADLGGRVVVEPLTRRIGGTAAVILGPSGAGIALQAWPPKESSE